MRSAEIRDFSAIKKDAGSELICAGLQVLEKKRLPMRSLLECNKQLIQVSELADE